MSIVSIGSEATTRHARETKNLRRPTLEPNRSKGGLLLFGNRLGSWTKKATLAYLPRDGFKPQISVSHFFFILELSLLLAYYAGKLHLWAAPFYGMFTKSN